MQKATAETAFADGEFMLIKKQVAATDYVE